MSERQILGLLSLLKSEIQSLHITGSQPYRLPPSTDSCWPKIETWVGWIKRSRCNLAVYGDSDYPIELQNLPDPPLVLFYFGQPTWQYQPMLAVVGSRRPAPESRAWMEWHLADTLRAVPLTVVSGGAMGIDQQAHWLAIRSGRPTIALMPVGLMNRYPPSFATMEAEILRSGGAILSPFAPDWPLFKGNFAVRNRVIAGLSAMVLVIEGRRRSGTLLTARQAIDIGRPIGALPTNPMSRGGQGNLDLIVEGATIIRDQLDLQMAFGTATQALR